MTCLHDIEKQMQEDRRFRGHWNTLKNEGLATMELLEFAWKEFENPAKDLIGILQAAGLLCPVHVTIPATKESDPNCPNGDSTDTGLHTISSPKESSNQLQKLPTESAPVSNGDLPDTGLQTVRKFVVPFHLAEKDLQRTWTKNCRKWKGICATDKVLIFDFQSFLPPALFNYVLVRTTAESETTNGMQPSISRDMGIFSFGDKFFFLMKRSAKYNQIQVNVR